LQSEVKKMAYFDGCMGERLWRRKAIKSLPSFDSLLEEEVPEGAKLLPRGIPDQILVPLPQLPCCLSPNQVMQVLWALTIIVVWFCSVGVVEVTILFKTRIGPYKTVVKGRLGRAFKALELRSKVASSIPSSVSNFSTPIVRKIN